MAEEFKFGINIKPRARDDFRGSGIVFMSVYLDWALDVTNAYLEKLGVAPPPNTIPTPVRQELTYHSPLLISEAARVYVRTTRIGHSGTTWLIHITEAKTGRPIVDITNIVVWMDTQTGQSVPYPDEQKEKVIAFEGKENVKVAGR